MKIGMIGAGRVGCSFGKYLVDRGKTVTGYYSQKYESAVCAAKFVGTDSFRRMEELTALSDTLLITTPDDRIGEVWDRMKEMSLDERVICHFSGSLSSDVFNGIDGKNAYGASIHPMLAFRDRFTSYGQLQKGFFTLEGHPHALQRLQALLEELGNPYCLIKAQDKAKYHCAASILSNDVLALLDLGFCLLEQCGFGKEEVLCAATALVRGNVENVLANGTRDSMTGPILRGDLSTVEKHLGVLEGEEREIYRLLGRRLLAMAGQRHGQEDLQERYDSLRRLLEQ